MRLFTVEQANRMLPLVRRIVEDVVRTQSLFEESIERLDLLVSGGGRDETAMAALEREIRQHARDMDAFKLELDSLGIQLKDRRIGLIDFPSELDGRVVLLCWRLGEPGVEFWHDVDAGFAGRQPLAPTLVG